MPIKLPLGSIQVNWSGETFTPAEAEALKNRKREEALFFCPALRSLSCSRFDIECSILNGMVSLEYFLVASALIDKDGLFQYFAGKPATIERTFEDEAFRVFANLQEVRALLSIAMSPTILRSDLIVEEPAAIERRQLRLAAKQFSGSLLDFPGVDRTTQIQVEKVPLYLPNGAKARIIARVKSMSRFEALLTKIELLGHSASCDTQYTLPKKMRLRRKIHANFAKFGPMLLHAQDHDLKITLDVIILFDWSNAQERMLDLVDVVTDQKI